MNVTDICFMISGFELFSLTVIPDDSELGWGLVLFNKKWGNVWD